MFFIELKRDKKFWQESTCNFKTDIRNLTSFDLNTLMGSFWTKYILYEPKKYRGDIFYETKEGCKIWKGIDFSFENWQKEFGKFWREHLKMSKLELWWDPFVQSAKCMSLKFTEELRVMIRKNDTKNEEELTCRFKIHIRNFTNLDQSTQKSKKCVFSLAACDQSI